MTQNKFWLVWNEAGNAPKKPHDTEEKAITEAKRLASVYPQNTYIVLEAKHSFKPYLNVFQTTFESTPDDFDKRCTPADEMNITPEKSLEVKHKFKIGDEVLYSDFDKNGILYWENGVIINIIDSQYVKVENKITNKIFTYELNGELIKIITI